MTYTKPLVGSAIAWKLKALRNSEPMTLDCRVYVLANTEVLAYARARRTEVVENFILGKMLILVLDIDSYLYGSLSTLPISRAFESRRSHFATCEQQLCQQTSCR